MSEFEAKAREIAESVLHGKFYFPALVPAISSALEDAVKEENGACAKLVSDTANSQRDLAKGNYSHEHHSAYMLDGAAASIRSRTQKSDMCHAVVR